MVYEVLNEFISDLKRAEKDWHYGSDLVRHQLATRQTQLRAFGKTKAEVVTTLLNFAALLATEPEDNDDYPAINFMHGETD